jgi:DNA-binding transcriptional LysR family regulator
MELRHLKYFIAVAEEENISRAAEKLHVAQPSLSRQIRDLEEELGIALFERTPRSIKLTEGGRFFLTEACEAVAGVERAISNIRSFVTGGRGEIHIGYAPSLTTKILPAALRNFEASLPNVRVKLHDFSTEEMLAGLNDKTFHACLMVKPSARALKGISFREIARYFPFVAMAPTHFLVSRKKLTRADLAEQALIAYSRFDFPEYHSWLERIFENQTMPRVMAEYDSSTSLIAALESGSGIAVVQENFSELAGTRLVIRPLQHPKSAYVSFGISWRNTDSSQMTQKFIEATETDSTQR